MALVLSERYANVRDFYLNRFQILRLCPTCWCVLALVELHEVVRPEYEVVLRPLVHLPMELLKGVSVHEFTINDGRSSGFAPSRLLPARRAHQNRRRALANR